MKIGKGAMVVLAGSIAVVFGVTAPSDEPATVELRPGTMNAGGPALMLAQYNPCPRGKCK